ncbi:MAG TPA: tyrosine--tRNA ligase [Candidatus Nanoarchaeia archaeon]|nr:tyrosine--tRNA ligase [Candidatus Nanoarchaeia archaeon]
MDVEERFNLIKRNTAEILVEDELKALLKEKKQPAAYIGFASTGRVHVGYFIPMMKIHDFLKAGFKFKILLADLHAMCDALKSPLHLIEARFEYYKEALHAMVEAFGIETQNLEFVKGSEVQLRREYQLDVIKLAATTTLSRCRRAASEVVKLGDDPRLSGFIYPLMQALDEQYLDVDVQYGGLDQRKILALAREVLPKIGYKARVEVMTPMLPGFTGSKMSSSDAKSKIDILDDTETIKKKMNGAHCPIGVVEENGVLAFVQYVIMVLKSDKKESFIISRDEKFGGDLEYKTYEDLEKDFIDKKLHPQDLKMAVAYEIDTLLSPIRKRFKGKEELLARAYPEA